MSILELIPIFLSFFMLGWIVVESIMMGIRAKREAEIAREEEFLRKIREASERYRRDCEAVERAYQESCRRYYEHIASNGSYQFSYKTAADFTPSWASVLGVSGNATVAEIKSAFRKKAKLHHPDLGGSKDEMSRLNAAFRVALASKGAA